MTTGSGEPISQLAPAYLGIWQGNISQALMLQADVGRLILAQARTQGQPIHITTGPAAGHMKVPHEIC